MSHNRFDMAYAQGFSIGAIYPTCEPYFALGGITKHFANEAVGKGCCIVRNKIFFYISFERASIVMCITVAHMPCD